MPDPGAVRAEAVSKKFCRSLRRSMWYGLHDAWTDAFGSSADRARELRPDEFWAVKDVSFSLGQGECLGLIGRNGAGKSSLLKLLNGVIRPDAGSIRLRGRVGALIEVGAGFHPMLTGRENVYVNGAILGLGRKYLDEHFEAIVDFAGVGEFIDSPVKHYSSGMYVRLGFAVAAHLNPDILLVDEVLAVGDMEFQAKCLEHVSRLCDAGCSVILVSHNEEMVRRVCQRGLLLDAGRVVLEGEVNDCFARYHTLPSSGWVGELRRAGNQKVEIQSVEFLDVDRVPRTTFRVGKAMTVRVHLVPRQAADGPVLEVAFNSNQGYVAGSLHSKFSGQSLGRLTEPSVVEIHVPSIPLAPGGYRVTALVSAPDLMEIYDWRRNSWDVVIEHDAYVKGAAWMPSEWKVVPADPHG